MFNNFFLSKNRAVYDIMWKNMVEPDRPQMTIIRRMRFACWITKATHTLGVYNTYCFATVTMVTPTRLNVTLCIHCLSCLYFVKLLAADCFEKQFDSLIALLDCTLVLDHCVDIAFRV